jgi:hypothetical protein
MLFVLKRLILILFITFFTLNSWSQDDDEYLSENNYMGYELFWPNLKKEWKNDGPWIGPSLQGGANNFYFRFGIGFGNAYKFHNDSSLRATGQYDYLGILYKPAIRIIRNIVALEPEIGLDFIYGKLKDPYSTDDYSIGIGVSPGIGLKVGPAKIFIRQVISYCIDWNKNYNPWSKGMVFPVVGIMLETGKGLLIPKQVTTSGWIKYSKQYKELLWTETKVEEKVNEFTKVRKVTTNDVYRTVTSYHDKNVSMTAPVISPFWYIAPYNTMSRVSNIDNPKTVLWGTELGFRFSFLALNGFYAKGNYGFSNPVPKSVLISHYGEVHNLNGTVPCSVYGADAGMDVLGFIFNSTRKDLEGYKWFNATLFIRFIIQYGYGIINFDGPVQYFSASAPEQLSNFYQMRPDLKPGNYGIPGGTASSDFTRWSFRFESGLVTLGYEKIKSKKSPYLNNRVFTLGFMIAPSRIYNKLRALHYSKKIAEKILQENKK